MAGRRSRLGSRFLLCLVGLGGVFSLHFSYCCVDFIVVALVILER